MKIAIIGAGLSGLSAAATLKAAGIDAVIFDKGRNVGGRCATRPTDWGSIDHGLQLLDQQDDRLKPLLQQTGLELEAVTFEAGAYQPVCGPGPFARPTEGARSFPNAIARNLDVRVSHTVTAIHRENGGWSIACEGSHQKKFDAVALAIPPAQAAAFNLHDGKLDLNKPRYTPQVAALIAHDQPLDLPETGPLTQEGLAWISKSRGGKRATILSAEPLSSALMDTDKDEIAALLWAKVGDGAAPKYLKGHRWRYSRVSVPMGTTHFWDGGEKLGYCGDWFIGPNAGDAVKSGSALAKDILAR